MDASSLMPLVVDGETGYPRLTPHKETDERMSVSAYEDLYCKKCVLPECFDASHLCPLPAINGRKSKGKRTGAKGQGQAKPVEVLGVKYGSVRQACIYLNISHASVYNYAKKSGLTPQAVLQAWAGFERKQK